ncbi:disulfide isomerase [Ophiocordyceps camponoti-floridani]|uniref:Disulfide isomerase n=1 Tax=Ophiocordyceps camponoti-floridani TaxID=2030778 RepID=A0A8H4VDA7_9HYPO|nr:disulfide isomerase [Ophiocordyceps camponoti-floridani]
MRLLALALVLGAAVPAWAQDGDPLPESTTFNSVTVPPLLDLTPSNWEQETKKSRWLVVKHYSPYCHHCKEFAPKYQTLYEYYYTSKADDGAPLLKSYDVQFAIINCIRYSDLCEEHSVQRYPTTVIFEKGIKFDALEGNQKIPAVSKFIEKALEKERPGSRPKELALPEAGAKESPPSNPSPDKADGKETPIDPPKAKADEPSATSNDKPLSTANPNGVSVPLTAESFQTLVTMTQDPWFIKLYAPWCHHCQALQPTWEQLAKSMQGKLHIGEVNCEKESALCKKDLNVKLYPTILFFKGGERTEYSGLRGLGDFVQYAKEAMQLAGGVPDVDAEELKKLEQKHDVIFVYFYDHATTSEDFKALERLPLSLIGHAKLVKTKDRKLYDRFKITTWPRLLVSREGRPTYYPPLTPDEMRDVRGVLDWMKSVWLPLVPELSPSNARQIMDGKLVVLGVLNHDDHDAFQASLREMKSAANEWMDRQLQEFQLERKKLRDSKQMRIEEAEDRNDQRALRAAKAIRVNMDSSGRKEVMFAWVDGVYWQRWIRTTYGIDVKDGERIIINDEDNRRYWDQTVTGNHMLVSRTSIMETLDKIVYGPNVIKPKLTISAPEKMLLDIRIALMEHPLLTLGCVVGISFGVVSWIRGRNRRRGGHFRLDDSMGIKELKDGLLGGNGNHKAD